jgi:spermidine synthase
MSIGPESLNLWLEDMHGDQVGMKLRLRECLSAATSPFQRIAVYDSFAFGRVLTLGGEIALTDLDEATYSESLVHPALQSFPDAKRVLILGGGDGGVAREVLRYGVQTVTVVEIDKQVVETCAKWFPAAAKGLADERVEVVIDDAHRFLRDCKTPYDVVIVDACELVNPASDAFNELPFAQTVFRCLVPGGVLIAPLGGPVFAAEACRVTLRKAAERFPQPRVYLTGLPSLPGGQLAIAWCSDGREPLAKAADAPFVSRLTSWHPALQAAQFALPRQTRHQLGLD